MKQIPILFSTPMVQAILAGQKTMTRRIVKTKKPEYSGIEKFVFDKNPFGDDEIWLAEDWCGNIVGALGNCPYGKPGDLLWVREEHKVSKDGDWWICEYKDGTVIRRYYKSFTLNTLKNLTKRKTLGQWQRARFLPKDLYRISLKIVSVRVERLENISNEDAIAEGIERIVIPNEPDFYKHYHSKVYDGGEIDATGNPKHSFKSLWISINGLESWTSDPWVWVVQFEKIK